MNITVFGGSQPRAGEPAYEEAYQLGKALGAQGHTVLTGGYIGTMEAVSHGAFESGGHVIGITCEEIERWRPVQPNPWVKEERRFPTIRQRLFELIEGCDAAIALPGGIGTLAEVAEMWSHLQTGAIARRPLILNGTGWQETLAVFMQEFSDYIPEKYRQLLTFCSTIDETLAFIAAYATPGARREPH